MAHEGTAEGRPEEAKAIEILSYEPWKKTGGRLESSYLYDLKMSMELTSPLGTATRNTLGFTQDFAREEDPKTGKLVNINVRLVLSNPDAAEAFFRERGLKLRITEEVQQAGGQIR